MVEYLEFEVALRDLKPRIWRRFLLKAKGATFWQLHQAIQDACGWQNCHLFEFREPGNGPRQRRIAGLPIDEDPMGHGEAVPPAKSVKLASYFDEKSHSECLYVYDFGDDWCHDVRLVGIQSLDETFRRRLLGGARAFPPEDCGGVPGYERCVQVVEEGKDPHEEDVLELMEWMGNWDPERFDLKALKRRFDK
jgi:hypothetical protein